jgi:hypothetical protein
MRCIASLVLMAVLAGLIIPYAAHAESDLPAVPPLELVKTITVGGMPDTIVVDTWRGRNDVLFYDLASSKVKILDGDTLQITADEVYLPHWGFDSWMSYDRALGHTYILQVQREYDWDDLMVSVLNRRELISSFSVNEPFNANTPVDFPYTIAGFAAKPAFLEVNVPGRLVVDNVYGGKLDIVDLDEVGLKPQHIHRHPYRQPLSAKQIRTFLGSSLALEPRHETTTIDDLANSDLLYLMDGNVSDKKIRSFRIAHGPGKPNVKEEATVDFSGIWPFSDGVQGLFVNGPADQLLVGTAIQSFDTGYIASVRTTDHVFKSQELVYCDPGFVLADWYDPNRIFVTAFDDFWNDPDAALYLRLLYGSATYSLVLESGFTQAPYVRNMAFDPYHRRLYITADDKIYVVQVNVGKPPAPLLPPRPAMATTVLRSPWYGGTLTAPENRCEAIFVGNSVNTETEVVYAETLNPPPPNGKLVVRAFELRATETATGDAVTTFLQPYYMTLHYTNSELGPVNEATCGLYWWNGSKWAREQAAQFDRKNNEVTVSLDHMSVFALLGEADERLYLPMMRK